MDEGDYFNFVRTGSADEESFQQEFCCTPADDNTAFLPYDLIAGCEYKERESWQTDLLDCKNPLFVGVDVGREHDLTVIWLIEQVNDINFTRRVVCPNRRLRRRSPLTTFSNYLRFVAAA
jgi:phage FluMu gp28-like protein